MTIGGACAVNGMERVLCIHKLHTVHTLHTLQGRDTGRVFHYAVQVNTTYGRTTMREQQ